MKVLISATMALLLAAAGPVWAHEGGHGKRYERGQYYGHYRDHWKPHHRHYGERRYYQPRYYYPRQRYYYEYSYGYPVYPAYPAPGVHIQLPNVYIPF